MLNEERDRVFEGLGWTVLSEQPFEIENDETGAFASGVAATIVQDYLIENYETLKDNGI